jgi:AAA domain-containing protein
LADARETPGADVAEATEAATLAERGTPSLPRGGGQGERSPQTTMLIELRADGCQTMVPPSLHPDGGWLRWGGGQVEPLHPARVTAAELRRAVARTAAAALLARYWPAQGSRDEAALALTGWLVKAGWMDDDADAFVLAVARAAQDEEWKRRALKAKHTRETIAAGRPVMGVNALAARLRGGAGYGAMVVTMVAQWLGLTSALSASHVSNAPLMSTQSPIRNDGHEWEIGHEWDDLDDEEVGTLFSEVKIEPLRWLWPGRLPLGKVTILDGDPGLGKSLITVDLAARVTTGRGMPDESPDEPDARLREPHGVVLLSAEDGPGDTIAPRLLAAGADLARVLDLHTVRDVDSATGTPYERGLLLPRDLRTLERGIKRMRARLVVIDPLKSFLDSSVNSFSDQDARTVLLEPLKRLAEENGATILLLRHLNKTTGGKAIYRGGGSIGFIGAARGGLLAAKDPDDPEHQRVLASGKSNLGPPLPSLRYHLVVDEGQTHPRVEWLEMCDYTADALVADVEEEPGAREEAEAWLEEQLAAGPRRGSEIKQLAAQAGISARTLRRARERVCEKPDRHGLRKGAYSLWQLRPAPQTPPTELPTAAEA